MGLEVTLAVVEQTADPAELALGGVVGVQHDSGSVGLGHGPDMLGAGDCSENGAGVVAVRHGLAGDERRSRVGELDDRR